MSNRGVLPMDSYRLAQYAVPTPCYICAGDNSFDAELCRHCHAPMALARHAAKSKQPQQVIATLGSADAGKTVYLGMLTDILSRKDSGLQLLARGAYSVSLQQNTVNALATCSFPTKTPNEPDRWNWVHCEARTPQRKRPLDLVMPDVAGEALMQEVEHPNTYPVIQNFLQKCRGTLLLLDAVDIDDGEPTQDFFGVKVLTYLLDLDDEQKPGWSQRPVAIVFTKADQCSACMSDPAEYARKHTPGVWQQCQERLQKHRFFACGVAGSCGYVTEAGGRRHIPLRVEPRGVVEPFRWVVESLGQK